MQARRDDVSGTETMSSSAGRTLATISEEIAQVRNALRRARKNEKVKARRSVSGGRQTTLYRAVLSVHALSEGTTELAAHYWIGIRTQCGCRNEDVSWERAVSVVSEWIASASVEDFHEAREPVTPAGVQAHRAAVEFLGGAGAALWASRMVRERGHAPSSHEVWREHENVVNAGDPASDDNICCARASNRLRSWARRWRRRWLFKKGKVKLRQRFAVDELRTKAGQQKRTFTMLLCSQPRDRFRDRKTGRFLSPRAEMLGRCSHRGGQKAGPVLGPCFLVSRH